MNINLTGTAKEKQTLKGEIRQSGMLTGSLQGRQSLAGAAYPRADDGFSPIVEVTENENGHLVEITDINGTKSFDVKDGYTPQKGIDYFDGYTPVKGVDYKDGEKGDAFTYEDFTSEQLAALKGKDGNPGKDGYTPIKGVDYFDGKPGKDGSPGADGYTPIKGVDYFDGEPGKDGVSATHSWNGTTLTVTSASGTSSADLKGGKGDPGYTPQKNVDYFDGKDGQNGKDGVSVTHSWNGTTLTVTSASGTSSADLKGEKGDPGSNANVTAASIKSALGYTPADKARLYPTPQDYGAKGDNKTDDTAAFQNALTNNRVVFVPGGKYKISGELVIESNCQLEFSQDAVLYFTQTTGNCISMKMSANIVGNYATVSVPYTFSGNVINIDCRLNSSLKEIPPFTQWDPMWKSARFITDLNIVKPDPRGFCYSMDGTCNGTAVYVRAEVGYATPNIWATNLSKLRIAGAFTYGIFAESRKSGVTDSNGWIHQMRVDGFIDGPEVGLYLKNIEHAYASVLILPRRAYTTDGQYIPYAKWGICLENSIDTNLLGSRVMDWNSMYSLWEEGNMYQHIALLGNCRDVKLDSHYYHGYPTYDIRSLIYAENPSNLATVSILEEPITRWFKPKDGLPYFNNGDTEKKLLLQEEFNDCFQTDYVPDFKDWLPLAIDKDGKIFNEIGYVKSGMRWGVEGNLATNTEWYGCTGLIPIKAGDTLYANAMSMGAGTDGVACVVLFDTSFNRVFSNTDKQLVANESSYYFTYTATDDGFTLKVKQPATTAYAAFTFRRELIGDSPAISVNEPLTYSQHGFLADSIAIKTVNVIGLDDAIETKIEQAVTNGDFDGEKGDRGTGLLPVTTAPSSYTTEVNGLTPTYRIALSTVQSQASVDEVFAGDTIRYSYYHYPIIYVDSSYVYCRARVSIRGATGAAGAAGATPVKGTDYWTEADKTEMVNAVLAALPVYSGEVL